MESEVAAILNRSLVLEPPSPDLPLSEIYGSTLKVTRPALQHYAAHGWWPALARMERIVAFDQAMLDTHADNRLPSREEARFLVAQHQNESRSWDTEATAADLLERINGRGDWQDHEADARRTLALAKMGPGLSAVKCVPR